MTDQEVPSWIGKTVGDRYHIEDLLGQGGMSAVYKAHDPNLKRTVAIKIIHPHLTENAEFVHRFEQEATLVAQLRHNNIVQVFDFNHQGSIYYMVMEYLIGDTLDRKLKALNEAGMRLPLADAIRIVGILCEAIDYAHQRRMIHRDLKPANIMLNLVNEPILMDFGIAKIIGGEVNTLTGAAIGTAAYMSPEQWKGRGADHRSDIYALGVILFEILSGQPPFQSDSTWGIMHQHLEEPVPDIRQINKNTPHTLVNIIERALAKEANNRFQTAAEMASALRTTAIHVQSPTDTLAARHLGRLSLLWQEVQDLFDDRNYAASLDRLDELRRTDPDYKAEQAAELRHDAIGRMFSRAVKLYNAGKLMDSSETIQSLRSRMPEYPGLDQLEKRIQEGLAQQKTQARLQQLYEDAVRFLNSHKYELALERWQTILAEPGSFNYLDKLQVEKRARQGIASNIYTEALAALSRKNIDQALVLWRRVQEYDVDFPDKQNLVGQIEDRQQEQQRKRALLLRVGGGVIAILLLVSIAVLIFRGRGDDDLAAFDLAATQTAVALATLPTETAAQTPAPTDTATSAPLSAGVRSSTPTTILANTQLPEADITPIEIPTETVLPEPDGSPTPENQAVVKENSTLFSAPDTGSNQVALLREDDVVLVYGRSTSGNWLYVYDLKGNRGFVDLDRIQWSGDVDALPVIGSIPRSTTPASSTSDLSLNIWGLPATVRCETSGSTVWYQTIFMEGIGGSGTYTYFWEGKRVGGPTVSSITSELRSNGGALAGTGSVTSSDGQTISKGLFLASPGCN
jgi:serine/threonine protein kinase